MTGRPTDCSPLGLSDEALITYLQRAAFEYFRTFVSADTGLVADTSRDGAPCSIAVVGFALSVYPIAAQNGWMSRAEAVGLTLTALRFFRDSKQSNARYATGYRGFYYHFLDMKSGARVWDCELSLIDSALLFAGILTSQMYFDGDGHEGEIRTIAAELLARADWTWALGEGSVVAQGWKPQGGFMHYGWQGYNEATLLYVLALGSETHPIKPAAFTEWASTYQWEHLMHHDVLFSGPLFTHLFSHAWIDFRGIRDAFMAHAGQDYFINTQRTIAMQRQYGDLNPHRFAGYSRHLWGISAGEGPSGIAPGPDGKPIQFFGYMSRGAPYGPDDGTLSPWGMLAVLPFDPDAAIDGVRELLQKFPQACRDGRFASGLNPTHTANGSEWISEGWYGLDQGLLVMMVENARSALNWSLMRASPLIQRGLKRAGFSGGWLSV